MERFTKSSIIKADVNKVFKWHEQEGALERLSPPWDPVKVVRKTGTIDKNASLRLQMHEGPFPYFWDAKHTDYVKDRYFADEQTRGPFASWKHTHVFEPDGPGRCRLTDIIDFSLPGGRFTETIMGPQIKKRLETIFTYRHLITAEDMLAHARLSGPPKTILISGSGGHIGQCLIPFLTTGGHRVIKLVRNRDRIKDDEIFWDPQKGEIESHKFKDIDVVIHLAGENIGRGRWTREKKKIIVESRTIGTNLIVKAMAAMEKKPEVFIAASAIGFYGNRGDSILTEDSPMGDDFISSVCHKWEQSSLMAENHGIRTAILRIGVVTSPLGGALERILEPMRFFMGGKLGKGGQYVSWVDMEDAIGAIHHMICRKELHGIFNVTAPEPVTNKALVESVAEILKKPSFFTVPAPVIRAAFGQMGDEIVLSSTRAVPERLLSCGFIFKRPSLENALVNMLGKNTGNQNCLK